MIFSNWSHTVTLSNLNIRISTHTHSTFLTNRSRNVCVCN